MGWLRKKKSVAAEISDEYVRAFNAAHPQKPGEWQERWEQYKWEVATRPDWTKMPAVDAEIRRSRLPSERPDATPEELEEEKKMNEEKLKTPFGRLKAKYEKDAWDKYYWEKEKNNTPTHKEDTKLWRALPPVPNFFNPRGPPLIRKALVGPNEASDRIMNFFKHFLFGLWGYRQRPYPPTHPIDVQQAIGYKNMERRYRDFTMKAGGWYYKDRLGRSRGPMELINMKTAWAAGIIDKNTFVWGDNLDEWVPISMLYGLEYCITTPDVRFAAQGTALIMKALRGIPLNTPKKWHEPKSYQQLQKEGLEARERDLAVERVAGGSWPGEREPGHAVFQWASGSQISDILEHPSYSTMPDKFISYENRKKLVKLCPGLRPKDILDIERMMDWMTFQGDWYREPFGTFTTRPDYERDYFEDLKEEYEDNAEELEHFFSCIKGGPKVKMPRKPYQHVVVEWPEEDKENAKAKGHIV